MQAKVLSPVEQDIVDGKQDDFLTEVLADERMQAGNEQVSDGREAFAEHGRRAYRLRHRFQVQLKQNFLGKPSFQQVITALHQGASLRDAAATSCVPIDVVRKVLAVMQKG